MEPLTFHDGRVELYAEDCLAVLKVLPDCFVDAVITDPPYHLTSIVKRFANAKPEAEAYAAKSNSAYMSRGFMGQQWDGGDIAFRPDVWRECLRVLKPGGHLASFGGTRTYHRMACAIEDAGFEIRDMLSWNFGSGFPKSHNIGKRLDANGDRCACSSDGDMRRVRDSDAEMALPTETNMPPDMLAPMQRRSARSRMGDARPQGRAGEDTRKLSVGGAENDGAEQSGMEGRRDIPEATRELCAGEICTLPGGPAFDGEGGWLHHGTSPSHGEDDRPPVDADGMRSSPRPQTIEQRTAELGALAGQPESQERGTWNHCERCGKPIVPDGLGTALKPAMELICLARKPLSEGTVAANVLRWGTGAINVDACRVSLNGDYKSKPNGRPSQTGLGDNYDPAKANLPDTVGRFPANLVHDGSPEVLAGFPETGVSSGGNTGKPANVYGDYAGLGGGAIGFGDRGSAARFFYCAKANKKDRAGSNHPTVKPISLIAWLVRMLTPPGGLVLDPFAGTGTLAAATFQENKRAILIEREELYRSDIVRRVEALAA